VSIDRGNFTQPEYANLFFYIDTAQEEENNHHDQEQRYYGDHNQNYSLSHVDARKVGKDVGCQTHYNDSYNGH